jgi:hypothetical protein
MSKRRDDAIIDAVKAIDAAGFGETADELTYAVISPVLLRNVDADGAADRMFMAGMPGEYGAIIESRGILGTRVVAFGDTVKVAARWDRDTEPAGIGPDATADGHRYVMGAVNAYCPRCTELAPVGITVLTCDFDESA